VEKVNLNGRAQRASIAGLGCAFTREQAGTGQLMEGEQRQIELLFRSLKVNNLSLGNRIVMAPMTREFAPFGVLEQGATDYYSLRARGGVGLIISEGTAVDHPVSHYTNRVPHFYGEEALRRWRQICVAVHDAGGHIFPQLWHAGLRRVREETSNPFELSIAPSIVGKRSLRAMDQCDIDSVIDAFARAAEVAQQIGFDGVAIHGAHGYLLDQFFWTRTNRRTDAYGGDVGKRVRFGVEAVSAIRRRTGPAFPILFRFSQWKGPPYDRELAQTPQELACYLEPLANAGVDIFDASMRRFWLPEFSGSDLNLAGWAKKITGKLTMAVGSVGLKHPLEFSVGRRNAPIPASVDNLTQLSEMLARGDFDLVGIGRGLLANPRWPQLVRAGRFEELRPYDPSRTTQMLEPSDLASR
jgi:2,4-dienoyl-CoA reductase-like NADH-dependent reductase (Old Yellow Enzyme family)